MFILLVHICWTFGPECRVTTGWVQALFIAVVALVTRVSVVFNWTVLGGMRGGRTVPADLCTRTFICVMPKVVTLVAPLDVKPVNNSVDIG